MNKKEVKATLEIPAQLPFLQAICWQIADVKHLTIKEMLCRYESGWDYWGVLGKPSSDELFFIQQISEYYQSWLVAELDSICPSPETPENNVIYRSTFKHEFHQKILTVLSLLKVEFLQECRAYFGGGTLSVEQGY
jgi:hypothetical protein